MTSGRQDTEWPGRAKACGAASNGYSSAIPADGFGTPSIDPVALIAVESTAALTEPA